MIDIVCDNCERTFRVDPATAGPKVPCPMCGDVNRVPQSGEEPVAGAVSVPGPDRLPPEDGPEQEIRVVRPAMFRAHPFRWVLVVLLALAGLIGAIVIAVTAGVAAWLVWPALIVGVAATLYFGWWWLSTHWWLKLIISNKRTVRHEGIIQRHTTEVLHDHVRSVDINQTFMQRILKVGSMGIDSAGQDGVEIEVRDIPTPYEVKAVIDQYRKM